MLKPSMSDAAQAARLTPAFAQVTEARPDWVDGPPGMHDHTYCVAVKSGSGRPRPNAGWRWRRPFARRRRTI